MTLPGVNRGTHREASLLKVSERVTDHEQVADVKLASSQVLGREAGHLQRFLARSTCFLDQVVDELLEFVSRQRGVQVARPGLVGADERKVDLGLHRR